MVVTVSGAELVVDIRESRTCELSRPLNEARSIFRAPAGGSIMPVGRCENDPIV
jgi:hypothetical protein